MIRLSPPYKQKSLLTQAFSHQKLSLLDAAAAIQKVSHVSLCLRQKNANTIGDDANPRQGYIVTCSTISVAIKGSY
jgi:hypothetical protein